MRKVVGEAVRAITVTAQSVSESLDHRQQTNAAPWTGLGTSRQERRSNLGLQVGEVFNPFSLFDGALVPSEILRSPDFRRKSWSLLACCSLRVVPLTPAVCAGAKTANTSGNIVTKDRAGSAGCAPNAIHESAPARRSRFLCLRFGAASAPWKAKGSSAESRGPGVRMNSSSCGMRSTIANPDHR